MKDIKKILFVCTGNSCRSIMAEAYLKSRVKEEGLDIEVKSAGTLGIKGMPPSKEALKIIQDQGLNSEGYASKPLTEELINWADMILIMEALHRYKIIDLVPDSDKKISLLGSFAGEGHETNIPDPIERPLAFYNFSFGIIKKSIEEFLKWLKK